MLFSSRLATVALSIACVLVPATASAELNLVDADALRLDLGAYVGSFSAYQTTPYETAGVLPDSTGTNAAVLRFEWKAGLGDNVTLDVQNRFFWSVSNRSNRLGSFGLGSTVPPDRTLDLRSTIVDENGVLLEHDLDRLAINIFTSVADITVGRQAVTWGNSTIFTVADLWTQFSPFELDTSQKRGVDAIRVLGYPGGFEVEAIVVDRGEDVEDLSGGFRVGWTLDRGDYYAGLAKSYERVWTLMGMAVDLGSIRGHGEIALPFGLEISTDEPPGLERPRLTIGADWFASSKFTAFAEYHYNGPGTADPDQYLNELQSPALARGERYFIGKHYAGLAAAYLPMEDTLTLALSTVANITDPSVLVSPSLAYQISQNATATLGGYFGAGDYPEIAFDPANPAITTFNVFSEYGLYGHVYFLQLAGYF